MGKKNIFMLIGAFVVGGLVVGALAYGNGADLQGRLRPGAVQNPLLPADKQQCTFTCETGKALVAEHEKQQNDITALATALSEANDRISGLSNELYQSKNGIAAEFIAVKDRLDYVESSLTSLWDYTAIRLSEASNKFEQLGVGGLNL